MAAGCSSKGAEDGACKSGRKYLEYRYRTHRAGRATIKATPMAAEFEMRRMRAQMAAKMPHVTRQKMLQQDNCTVVPQIPRGGGGAYIYKCAAKYLRGGYILPLMGSRLCSISQHSLFHSLSLLPCAFMPA